MASASLGFLSALAVVLLIVCFWTTPTDAYCQPHRCESGTLKSGRCKNGMDVDECFNKITTATFAKKYSEPPQVHYGLSHMDIVKDGEQRNSAILVEVTNQDFSILWDCKKPTFCYGADINWMACGIEA